MGEIYLDHEKVLFDGPEPADAEALFNLLNQIMGEQERCIVSFEVDGCDFLRGQVKTDLQSYDKVVATSSRRSNVYRDIIADFLNNNGNLSEELISYGAVVLSLPWSKVVARIEEFSVKMQPFQDILEALVAYGRDGNFVWLELLENQFGQLEKELEKFLENAARGDVGQISDIIVCDLAVSVKTLVETLAGPVTEDLDLRSREFVA